LCADHFDENSFKGEGKKSLKRGSIPIPFRNIVSRENNNDINMESMPFAKEVADTENTINVMGAKEKRKHENTIRPRTLENIENDEMRTIISMATITNLSVTATTFRYDIGRGRCHGMDTFGTTNTIQKK